jgi:transposase-like protein
MKKLSLCISDAHARIQAAVRKEWLGTSWPRSKVHFIRNILAKVPHKEKSRFAERVKQIWLQPDKRSAKRMAALFGEEYEKRFPEAIHCLEEGLEDSLQYYHFPEIDKKRISSTNVVERIVREIRRRSRVIGVFPTVDSYVRLVACYFVEYSEDWGSDRSDIKQEKILAALEQSRELLATQGAN